MPYIFLYSMGVKFFLSIVFLAILPSFLIAQKSNFELDSQSLDDKLLLEKIILDKQVERKNRKDRSNFLSSKSLLRHKNSKEEIIEPLGSSIGLRYLLFVKTYRSIDGRKSKELIYFDRLNNTQHIFLSNDPKSYLEKKKKYNSKFNIIQNFNPVFFSFENNTVETEALPFELKYEISYKNKLPKLQLFFVGGGYLYGGINFLFDKIPLRSPKVSVVYNCVKNLAIIIEYSFLSENISIVKKEIFFLPTDDIVTNDKYKLSRTNNYSLSANQQKNIHQVKYTYHENYIKKDSFFFSGIVYTEYLTNALPKF